MPVAAQRRQAAARADLPHHQLRAVAAALARRKVHAIPGECEAGEGPAACRRTSSSCARGQAAPATATARGLRGEKRRLLLSMAVVQHNVGAGAVGKQARHDGVVRECSGGGERTTSSSAVHGGGRLRRTGSHTVDALQAEGLHAGCGRCGRNRLLHCCGGLQTSVRGQVLAGVWPIPVHSSALYKKPLVVSLWA